MAHSGLFYATYFVFSTRKIKKSVMAIIRELNGHTPKFGKNCFLAENAAVIGEVEMGDD